MIATYEYRDKGGALVGKVERIEPGRNGRAKDFLAYHFDAGAFKIGLNGKTLPLYRADELARAIADKQTVIFVEGEAKADALRESLRKAGSLAAVTTVQGGANAPMGDEHLGALAGAARIVVLPDSDGPGRKAAQARADAIAWRYASADVRVIDLYPGCDDGSDVADWLAEGHTLKELRKLVHATHQHEARPQETNGGDADGEGPRLRMIPARDVALTPTRWLMRDRIPRDELTLFDGDGGIGKTTVAMTLIAALTTGALLPDGLRRGPWTCLVMADENRRSDLVAILRTAGADISRVVFAPIVEWSGGEGTFRLPEHVPLLEAALKKSEAEIVYIDALFDHFGTAEDGKRINPSSPADVREALRPLTRLAHDRAKTIIATRHWGKTQRGASHRGYGAADLTNVARAVLAFAKHPSDETRCVIAVAKRNLGQGADALVYQILSAEVLTDDGRPIIDDDGKLWTVGRVAWHETERISADALAMAAPETGDERSASQEAREAILDALSESDLPADDLAKRVKEAGVADVTFRRARRALRSEGAITRSGGGRYGPIRWHLRHPPAHSGSSGSRSGYEREERSEPDEATSVEEIEQLI